MFNILAFCALFGLFMLRSSLFNWRSMISSDNLDQDVHMFTFILFFFVSLIITSVVMICRTNAASRLKTEYKDVYLTPVEFLAGIKPAEVGAAKFSENVKCEADAD